MKPTPDDSDPLRSTPKRIADELEAVGLVLAKLCIRVRRLAPFVGFADLKALGTLLGDASAEAVDLSSAVRVGTIRLATPLVDRTPAAGDQPLIELAEKNRKPLFDGLAERLAALAERLAALDRQELEHADAQADQNVARDLRRVRAALDAAGDPDGPRNGFVELPDERRSSRSAAAVKANETRKREDAEPKPAWLIDRHGDPLDGEKKFVIYDNGKSELLATISAPNLGAASLRTRELFPRRKPSALTVEPYELYHGPFPVEDEPAPDPPPPEPKTIALPTDADERKARKREADRKYQAAKKAKRDLAKAIGNPVEGDGSPLPPYRGREPVIDRPTAPAKSMSPESDRTWEVYDTRVDPHTLMGTVVGANITRASIAAEQCWPDLPKRMFKIIEKIARGRRPANRLARPDPDPDVELADFRREWQADDDEAAERLERTEPDDDHGDARAAEVLGDVGTMGRQKRKGVAK